jgi:hypothetical protein
MSRDAVTLRYADHRCSISGAGNGKGSIILCKVCKRVYIQTSQDCYRPIRKRERRRYNVDALIAEWDLEATHD